MQAELQEKESVLSAMEAELAKAQQLNDQVDHAFHKCDIELCQHAELVGQLSDRWLRIRNQINTRQDTPLSLWLHHPVSHHSCVPSAMYLNLCSLYLSSSLCLSLSLSLPIHHSIIPS